MRRFGAVLALGLAAFIASVCGGGPESPPEARPEQQAQQTAAEQQVQVGESPQAQSDAPPVETIELSAADIGPHLEDTEHSADLPNILAEMSDPILAALPGRARRSEGRLMVPSPQAETGETFWMHVFYDASPESATAWVEYLAAQPAGVALVFTITDHMLMESESRLLPDLGDAAVSIELLHGHEGGRWRTELVIFAQDGVIVFVKASRREEFDALTDVEAVARLISERQRAPAPAARSGE